MTEPPPPPPAPPPLSDALAPPILPAPPVSRFGLALIVMTLGFGGFISIGVVTQLLSVSFGLWWCEIVIFFGLPFVALKLSGRAPLQALGLRRPWLAGAVFGFALGVTNFFAAAAPLQYLSQLLAPKSLLEVYDAAQVFRDKGPLELALIIGGVTLAAPLCEESFFRGLLQPGLNEKLSVPLTIITTGMIFSFFHLDPVGFLARWELGIVFGLLAWRSGSLWPGIFMHLANNLTSTVLYFIARGEPDDGTNDPSSVAAIAGVGGLLLLLVLLAARRFPRVLEAPVRSEEVRVPANPPLIVAPWMFGAFLSLAALLALDWRGSMVRAIDSIFPVKHPAASLKDARDRALRGDMSLGDYRRARIGEKDGGVTDAPAPPHDVNAP